MALSLGNAIRLTREDRTHLQTHQNDRPHRNGYTGIHHNVHRLAQRWNQEEDCTVFLRGLIVDFCSDVFQCNGQYIEESKKTKEYDGGRFTGQTRPRENNQAEGVE
jgi:hypothetical protein